MKPLSNEPWNGPSKIILGIDVGTTHSAVSFSYLFEGAPQTVQHVSQWPGQGAHKGYSKIPTLVYYDRDLKPVCYGAEALQSENRDQAEDEGWSLAKYFKLHLHPRSMTTQGKWDLRPLPAGVSLATIYTDFLSYLLRHTRSYFESRIVGGPAVWEKCSPNMLIVLTHPNGWATREQHFLRQALRNVGPAYKNCQITFVTEGEASVHFCVFYSIMGSSLQPGNDLIVCDAGGSTIDTTAYQVERTTPSLEIKEKKASACIQTGGVFVDLECERYLKDLLTKARVDEEDIKVYVAAAVEDFESTVKKEFVSPDIARHINFHDNGFKQAELGIRRGRMSLKGSIIQSFFDRIVSSTIQSVRQQIQGLNPKYLLLVGGFGESLYLRRRLSQELTGLDCQVVVTEDSTSKAAADGAVIWAVKLAVIGRVTRVAFGTPTGAPYNSSNPEHQGREVTRLPQGDSVDSCWSELVGKGVFLLDAEASVRHNFWFALKPGEFSRNPNKRWATTIWVFYGDPADNPGWIRDKSGKINPGFEQLCVVGADFSGMEGSLKRIRGANGPFDQLSMDIVILLGGTELRAHMEWIENGTKRTGPVTIMPDPIGLPPVGRNMPS